MLAFCSANEDFGGLFVKNHSQPTLLFSYLFIFVSFCLFIFKWRSARPHQFHSLKPRFTIRPSRTTRQELTDDTRFDWSAPMSSRTNWSDRTTESDSKSYRVLKAGSVSASWDDRERAFLKELRVSSFPWQVPTLCLDRMVSPSDFIVESRVQMCLAVTCQQHFGKNDRGLLRATAVTRGWIERRIFPDRTEIWPWRRTFSPPPPPHPHPRFGTRNLYLLVVSSVVIKFSWL